MMMTSAATKAILSRLVTPPRLLLLFEETRLVVRVACWEREVVWDKEWQEG